MIVRYITTYSASPQQSLTKLGTRAAVNGPHNWAQNHLRFTCCNQRMTSCDVQRGTCGDSFSGTSSPMSRSAWPAKRAACWTTPDAKRFSGSIAPMSRKNYKKTVNVRKRINFYASIEVLKCCYQIVLNCTAFTNVGILFGTYVVPGTWPPFRTFSLSAV